MLKPFEENLNTMFFNGYTRGLTTQSKKILVEIYREVTGSNKPISINCWNCIKEVLEELSKLYYHKEDLYGKETDSDRDDVPDREDSGNVSQGIPDEGYTEDVTGLLRPDDTAVSGQGDSGRKEHSKAGQSRKRGQESY